DTQPELHQSWICIRIRGYLAHRTRRERARRKVKLRMVKDVEKFCPELNAFVFHEWEVLEHCEICVHGVRTGKCVPTSVADVRGSSRGEYSCIECVIRIPHVCCQAGKSRLETCPIDKLVESAEISVSEITPYGKRESASIRGDTPDLPIADDLIDDSRRRTQNAVSMTDGQIVVISNHHAVADIEVR